MRQPYNNYLLIFCIATISPMHKGLFSVWSYNTLEKPSMHGGGVVIVSLYKSKLLLSGHISFVFHLLRVVPYIYNLCHTTLCKSPVCNWAKISRIWKAACYFVLYFTCYNNKFCICFIFLPLYVAPYIYHL